MILVVEDNPASLEILEIRLKATGYEVMCAVDGEQGLALTKKHNPDLILLDLLMPKMDGLEVCRRVKSDTSLPFIPIIIVTAKSDSKDIVSGLESGGDDYLTKPVNHTALMARVKSMLRIKELHDTVLEQSSRLQKQLKTAANVQSQFWPELPELGDNSKIWATSVPATYVGGDLYDILNKSDKSIIAYVADVSDKGVPAALIMAALSTIVRNEATVHDDLAALVGAANNRLYNLTADEGYFATLIIARYWPVSGCLQMIRAGHPHPVLIDQGGLLELPELKGVALGVVLDADFESQEIYLQSGQSILFYSDGVVEATNAEGELYGEEQMMSTLTSIEVLPRGKGLLEKVDEWKGQSVPNDDITLLEIWKE